MSNINFKILKCANVAVILLFSVELLISCKKQIEVSAPPTSINSQNIYATDASAASVLTGIYAEISNQNSYNVTSVGITESIGNISIFTGLSADELSLYGSSFL